MSETAPEFQPPGPSKGPMGISPKVWIIGGIAAAGVVWYAYRRSAANATTTDPNATDPNAAYYDSSQYGAYSDSGYSPAYGYPTGTGTSTQITTPAPVVTINNPKAMTNREWYQKAVPLLGQHGVTIPHARAVLSEYLLMVPLTTDEIRIVELATRLEGPPPNPPHITHIPNPPHKKKK